MVLVDTGAFEYGLVVEELHDTVEIVVKPLGRHLKGLHDYAGATILGDGRVAVILDVAGLAARARLSAGKVDAAPATGRVATAAAQRAKCTRCSCSTMRLARTARCRSSRYRASSGYARNRSSIWAEGAPCSTAAPAFRW